MFLRQTHNFWVDNYLNWRLKLHSYYTHKYNNASLFNQILRTGGNNIFPFRNIELRESAGSTLPEAMNEYISKITGNAIFAGQLTGSKIGEYAIFGEWWEGGSGMCILISACSLILASKLYGNPEWTTRVI